MVKIVIEGKPITVDDSFLKLSPDEQHSTIDEIAGKLGIKPNQAASQSLPAPAPDATQVAPSSMLDAMAGKGVDPSAIGPGGIDLKSGDDGSKNAFGVGFSNGVPFASRAAAAIKATMHSVQGDGEFNSDGTWGSNYDIALKHLQQIKDQADQEHPWATKAGGLTGSIAATGPALAAAGVVGPIAGAASLGARALNGAAVGAGMGAVQGASDTKDLTNIPQASQDISTGAISGTVLGGAVPVVGAGVGAAYRSIAPFLQRAPDGMSRAASGLLSNAMNGQEGAKLAQLGPDAMLADTGQGLLGLAQGVATKEPGGLLNQALEARHLDQSNRILKSFDENLGPAFSPTDIRTQMRGKMDAAGPLYQAATDAAPPIDTSETLAKVGQMLNTAEGGPKKALTNLRDMLMTTEERPLLNPDGSQVMTQGPAVRNSPNPYQPMGPRPQSLQTFIRSKGGINDVGGDLESMGLGSLHNKNGMSYDMARRTAAEAGYLGGDTESAVRDTYVQDLLDKIGDKNAYSIFDEPRVIEGDSRAAARMGSSGQPRASSWQAGPDIPATTQATVPKTAFENLLNIRKEVDRVLPGDAPGLGVSAGSLAKDDPQLTIARGLLNQDLKSQVPGLERADLAYSTAAKGGESFQNGFDALQGGKSAPWGSDVAKRFDALPLEQQALERTGVRSRISQDFGTNRNDLQAALKNVGGENDFNREKMATYFGKDAADKVVGNIKAEQKFADTYNKVSQGSQTANRTQALKALEEATPNFAIPKDATVMGLLGHAGEYGLRKAYGSLASIAGERARADLTRALISQDGIPAGLLDQFAKINASNRIFGQSLGNSAGLASGLIANENQRYSRRVKR